MATKKVTPRKKAPTKGAVKESVKPIPVKDETPTQIPDQKEEEITAIDETQEGVQDKEGSGESMTEQMVNGEEMTEEQIRYVQAFNKHKELFGNYPSTQLSTEEIEQLNAPLEGTANEALPQEPDPEMGNKEVLPEAINEPVDSRFIVIEKDGEKKRLSKVTWNTVKGTMDGWKEAATIPKEVQELNGHKK